MSILQLMYRSQTSSDVGPNTMAEIAELSAIKNRFFGITGFLFWQRPTVVQMLEGNEGDVNNLMTRIKADGRHYGVTVAYTDHTSAILYPDWPMKFWDMSHNATCRHTREAVLGAFPDYLRVIISTLISLPNNSSESGQL